MEKPLASPTFLKQIDQNPGWQQMLANDQFHKAKSKAGKGMLVATAAGLAYLTINHRILRCAMAGMPVGVFAVAAGHLLLGIGHKFDAMQLQWRNPRRPEPQLPRPPIAKQAVLER